MTDRDTIDASVKTLRILDLLLRHFAHGLTNADIARSTGYDRPVVTRHLQTLESAGFVEKIPETGRFRPSVRLARSALEILRSMEAAKGRLEEIKTRITGA
jgi:DNA-binding IclR family transcriptional regulator